MSSKRNFLDRLFPEKLSISVTIFLLFSVLVRLVGIACIGLAFYIKYGGGNRIIDDSALPALNSIEMYGMPFGSYIQTLVFSTAVVFGSEFITGVIGVVASVGKKNAVLIAYMCLCMVSVLVYIVLIVLWSILHHFVKHRLEACFSEYRNRYQSSNTLLNGYKVKWQNLYSNVSCCGSSGTETECAGAIGCQDRYESSLNLYALVYISVFIICIGCQICSILAADYTIIKRNIKTNNNVKVSQNKSFILCTCGHGVFSMIWNKMRSNPVQMTSLIIKVISVISGTALVITSLWLLASGLLYKSELVSFFEKVHAYNYNLHDSLTGFCCSVLAIGCLTIVNAIVGIIGSRRTSTICHTSTFFGSLLMAILKFIASTVWIIMLEKFNRSIFNDLVTLASSTDNVSIMLTNQVMLFFKCCGIGTRYVQHFCRSNVHESITSLSEHYYKSNTINGISTNQDNQVWCAPKIATTIKTYSGIHFAFLAIGLISDILTMIFTSKEFKESQITQEQQSVENTKFHLIPWYISMYRKNPRWFLVNFFYILMTVIMLLFELSFIVLVAIFGVSYHVSRAYIDDIGDLFKFLAISGLVLVPLFIVNRFIGLAAMLKKKNGLMYVSTGLTVLSIILSSTYMIMTSVLRHREYPCKYYDSGTEIGCSPELEATSGVAIGMFVFEFVSQLLAIVLNDRGHRCFPNESSDDSTSRQPGLIITLHNFLFVNREVFDGNPKLRKTISAYAVTCCVIMLIEVTFIVLDCFYAYTWLLDRSWITSGLHDIWRGTINVGVLFNFLRTAFLALIPIICVNRIIGGIAIIKKLRMVVYVNSILTGFTIIFTLACLGLTSIVMESLAGCDMELPYGAQEKCPTRKKTIVGTAIAMLILEILIQITSLIVNDRCYKYLKANNEETEGLANEREHKRGLFITIYDKTFRRRDRFQGAEKLEIAIGIHVAVAVFLFMIEITFFVLAILYGLTSVINRDWIETGLDNIFVTSMDMEVLYQFLAICSVALVPLIIINRFIGIIAVSKKWKHVLYVSSVLLGVFLIIITVCLVLGSVLLYQEPKCSYTLSSNHEASCPRMKATVGIGIAILIIEFFMQVFSLVINDRSHIYISSTGDVQQEEAKGMLAAFYNAAFRQRKTVTRSKHFDIAAGVYVVVSTLFLLLEITFIVLIAVYGLSNVVNRDWITVGLDVVYIGGMDMETLYKFLAIGSLVLVPVNIVGRYFGLGILSFEKRNWVKISFGVSLVLLLINTVFVILGSMLMSKEKNCGFTDISGYNSCSRMKEIVGTGLGMLMAELAIQITSVIINDRMYKFLVDQQEDPQDRHGFFSKIIIWLFYGREVFIKYSKLKIPLIVMTIFSAGWLLVQCAFWIGTVLVFGSPRYINSTSMQTLFDERLDDINLGHLANGLAYTAIGYVPVIILFRLLAIVMTFKEKSTVVLVCFLTGIVLSIGCASLLGLSGYLIKYVQNCFGSPEWRCNNKLTEPILTASVIFLTFFIIETILHILQSVLFGYVVVLLTGFKRRNLEIVQMSGKIKRIKIADISVRSFEMILEFTMLLALIFWLSEIHIMTTTLRTSLHEISFHDANLYQLAKGSVITSIVSISICFFNNIIGVVAAVDGIRTLMIGSLGAGVLCVVVNCVLLGLQCVLENKIEHAAITMYLSFTVIQITCQVLWIGLSFIQLKEGNHTQVHSSDSDTPLTERPNKRKPSNVLSVKELD